MKWCTHLMKRAIVWSNDNAHKKNWSDFDEAWGRLWQGGIAHSIFNYAHKKNLFEGDSKGAQGGTAPQLASHTRDPNRQRRVFLRKAPTCASVAGFLIP